MIMLNIVDMFVCISLCGFEEYLRSLREILAKAAVDVNCFGAGGVTALMLAASRGSTGASPL